MLGKILTISFLYVFMMLRVKTALLFALYKIISDHLYPAPSQAASSQQDVSAGAVLGTPQM